MLSWEWPLISINWIPEILSSISTVIEPSWEGLKRDLTHKSVNKSFGNRIFHQIKKFCVETKIVEERNRIISSTIENNTEYLQKHLFDLYMNSSDNWDGFHKFIYEKKIVLNFNEIGQFSNKWNLISTYSVFKQWCEFFQYVGLGFLVNFDQYIPESIIDLKMIQNNNFTEKIIKSIGDPRWLSGQTSLHTECERFMWTKGEDILPLSSDKNLKPRIPIETITKSFNDLSPYPCAISKSLVLGINKWKYSIDKLLNPYSFYPFDKLIFTCKQIIDYFLFGKPETSTDELDKDYLSSVKKIWGNIANFKIRSDIWGLLPNLYRDITRLYWGMAFFRNSLHKPLNFDSFFDESIFDFDIKKISFLPIKCKRSKRTLSAIIVHFKTIITSLSIIQSKKIDEQYEIKTRALINELRYYLPSNQLELSDLISEVTSTIPISQNEKDNILNVSKIDIITDNTNIPILNLCFWIHRFNIISTNTTIINIKLIKERIDNNCFELLSKIKYFESNLDDLNNSYNELKTIVRQMKII